MGQLVHLDRDAGQARVLPFLDGELNDGGEPVPAARQAQAGHLGPDRLGGQDHAVQDQVRRAGKQRLVLLARGLALHAVRDDHGRSAPGGDGPHLDAGGEARAAAPGQARRRYLVDQVVHASPPARAAGQVAVAVGMLAEGRRMAGLVPADGEALDEAGGLPPVAAARAGAGAGGRGHRAPAAGARTRPLAWLPLITSVSWACSVRWPGPAEPPAAGASRTVPPDIEMPDPSGVPRSAMVTSVAS